MLLDDNGLASYIPQYGDRIAVKNFCLNKTPRTSKKDIFLDKLRKRMAEKEQIEKETKLPIAMTRSDI